MNSTSVGPVAVQKKQMRHCPFIRTECCPALSPFSSSKWLPGGKRKSSTTTAASSAVSIALLRFTKSLGKPLPYLPWTALAARLPLVLWIMLDVYHYEIPVSTYDTCPAPMYIKWRFMGQALSETLPKPNGP